MKFKHSHNVITDLSRRLVYSYHWQYSNRYVSRSAIIGMLGVIYFDNGLMYSWKKKIEFRVPLLGIS